MKKLIWLGLIGLTLNVSCKEIKSHAKIIGLEKADDKFGNSNHTAYIEYIDGQSIGEKRGLTIQGVDFYSYKVGDTIMVTDY